MSDVSVQMGAIPAWVANHPARRRGDHPLNSFAALGPLADVLIGEQSPTNVYAPLDMVAHLKGAVALLGVDLTSMTLLHLAEQRAGRELFVRWARLDTGADIPTRVGSCSRGFERLAKTLTPAEAPNLLDYAGTCAPGAARLRPMRGVTTRPMARPLSLTWTRVLAWRAPRSHLTTPSTADVVAVARRLCGVQAQVMSAAELALSIRRRSHSRRRERCAVARAIAREDVDRAEARCISWRPTTLRCGSRRSRRAAVLSQAGVGSGTTGVSAAEMDLMLDGSTRPPVHVEGTLLPRAPQPCAHHDVNQAALAHASAREVDDVDIQWERIAGRLGCVPGMRVPHTVDSW